MHAVFAAFGRASLSLMHFRMLFLTVAPFLLAVLAWGIVLWFGLQPLIDAVHGWFAANEAFRATGEWLEGMGLEALKTAIVPLLAMWLLLPLMIVSALVFVGLMAMPAINRHVAEKYFPGLERRKGGSLWGSIALSAKTFALFVVLWILTLPLTALPPIALVIQPLLWGWLTYRVMAYDALAEHADEQERTGILRQHRWPLLLIGAISGMLGAAPALLWFGGVLAVVLAVFLLPLFVLVAIWLYILVFVFTGLWFQHYCLDALAKSRQADAVRA